MRQRIAIIFAVGIAAATSALAQVPECGTTEARVRHAEEMQLWSESRQNAHTGRAALLGSASAAIRDGVFVVPADETTAPFRRPFDLEGRTILFARKDDRTFVRSTVALDYEDMTGATTLTPMDGTLQVGIKNFAFPFFGTSVTEVAVSGLNAIFPGQGMKTPAEQLNDADLASVRVPIIAPLWMTATAQGSQYANVYVKELPDRLLVSWIVDRSVASYDVQATLFRTGDIRFSYKSVKRARAAGVLITSGNEPWRSERTELVSAVDPQGDVAGNPSATLLPLLDIDSVTVARIAASNLLEVRIKVRGTASQLAAGESAIYAVYIGDSALKQYAVLYVSSNGDGTYAVPVWGSAAASPAGHIEGDTVTLTLMQDTLAGSLKDVSIRFYSQAGNGTNWADIGPKVTATFDAPAQSIHTDFSAAGIADTNGPIEEAFTLPVLSVGGVWSEIKQAYGIKDEQIDGVAIYQNFQTDLILYAGAYSTGGNAGAKGIKTSGGIGPDLPRTPALMHMNSTGYGWNSSPNNAGSVIMHEFGHRWLLQIAIKEDGQNRNVLNPASAHPAQYVHTPASNRVVGDRDASVMGGSTFVDNGNGTFSAPPFSNFAYSSLDLYLMGLAEKAEVPPWYYIADSDPKLGDSYFPPDNITVKGTRKDVSIQQVIDAMGERVPAYPGTQRSFNVFFILLTNPDREPTSEEIAAVASYRRQLETKFPIATGGRASVSTTYATGGPRRRTSGR